MCSFSVIGCCNSLKIPKNWRKDLKTVKMTSVFSLFSGPWKCTPKTDQRVQMIASWSFPYCDLWTLVHTDRTPVLALQARLYLQLKLNLHVLHLSIQIWIQCYLYLKLCTRLYKSRAILVFLICYFANLRIHYLTILQLICMRFRWFRFTVCFPCQCVVRTSL